MAVDENIEDKEEEIKPEPLEVTVVSTKREQEKPYEGDDMSEYFEIVVSKEDIESEDYE